MVFPLLALSCCLAMSWVLMRRCGGVQALWLALACSALIAAAFGLGRGWAGGLRGAGCGLLFCLQGACACRWVPMTAAIERAGGVFASSLLAWGLPLALASSLALTGAAMMLADLRAARGRLIICLLLAWALPTVAVELRLRRAWGFGPETLAEAAGVASAARSPEVTVAVLRPEAAAVLKSPEARTSFRFERRAQSVDGLDASPESLERLDGYLMEHGFRSVFAPQALSVWRRGWLLWWDSDRALEAASLRVRGRVVPDYLTALALIRAGPLTTQRFARLEALHEAAAADSAGFEDVNTSQLCFEAFSAAFARFDDEARARYWLGRVENLWPLNDKKVEVTPLEALRDGSVSGTLLIDGRPASSVRVGLFLELFSEASKKTTFALSSSAFPDSAGDFSFENLGLGRYHLELQASPEQLRGNIFGSPGVITISETETSVRLKPILIDRRPLPGFEGEAAVQDWLRFRHGALPALPRPRSKP